MSNQQPLILGLAGGVGSGKSTVAREFARRGFLVIDYDAEARAALDRPEVRQTLQQWWGAGVVGADGRIDRRVVAEHVFADEDQRLRLEGLIHPLVKRTRRQAQQMAAQAPGGAAPGVVMDAPLLFEAGLDTECDVLIFVEASPDTRLERVRRSRGWDAAELNRREASQWPLDQKRKACGVVIHNDDADGSSTRISEQVDVVCATLGGRAGGS